MTKRSAARLNKDARVVFPPATVTHLLKLKSDFDMIIAEAAVAESTFKLAARRAFNEMGVSVDTHVMCFTCGLARRPEFSPNGAPLPCSCNGQQPETA